MSNKKIDPLDVTVSKWSTTGIKIALDEAVKEIMTKEYGMEESCKLMDGRLILTTIAILVTGVAMLYDYLFPHPASRSVLITCVLIYYVISGVMHLYMMLIEKNIFFLGKMSDPAGLEPPQTWYVSSRIGKYDPTYVLTFKNINDKKKFQQTFVMERVASDFFDLHGHLRADLFQSAIDKLDLFAADSKAK